MCDFPQVVKNGSRHDSINKTQMFAVTFMFKQNFLRKPIPIHYAD